MHRRVILIRRAIRRLELVVQTSAILIRPALLVTLMQCLAAMLVTTCLQVDRMVTITDLPVDRIILQDPVDRMITMV